MTAITRVSALATLSFALAATACEELASPEPETRYVVVDQGARSNNSVPFGGAFDQRYQQIYAAEALGEGGRITSIAFLSPGQAPQPLATGDYLFRLEATSLPVMALSGDMNENLGPGAKTVIQRRIASMAYGDTLVFQLDEPFTYDPADGNLLLDLVISNPVDQGGEIRTFTAVRYSAVTSRRPAYGGAGDGYGLVTIFGIQ
jgi:hypothetical protein